MTLSESMAEFKVKFGDAVFDILDVLVKYSLVATYIFLALMWILLMLDMVFIFRGIDYGFWVLDMLWGACLNLIVFFIAAYLRERME